MRTLSDRLLLLIRADEQARQMPAVGGIFRPAAAPVPPPYCCDGIQCFNQSSPRKRRNEGEWVKEATLQTSFCPLERFFFFFLHSELCSHICTENTCRFAYSCSWEKVYLNITKLLRLKERGVLLLPAERASFLALCLWCVCCAPENVNKQFIELKPRSRTWALFLLPVGFQSITARLMQGGENPLFFSLPHPITQTRRERERAI